MPIELFRYDGLKVSEPVIEPLLSESSLLERGIYELNKSAQGSTNITASISYRGGLKLGQLVSLPDLTNSVPIKAKIIGIAITFSNGLANQTLTLQKALI